MKRRVSRARGKAWESRYQSARGAMGLATVGSILEPLEGRVLLSTRYVDANAPGPVHDGSSWDDAYLEIQQALSAARAGDEIRVADGTYLSTATSRVQLQTSVRLLGGFAGHGAVDPDARDVLGTPSVIAGSSTGLNDGLVRGGGSGATAVFDGFTLESNSDDGTSIYNYVGSPTINNCIFRGGMGINNSGSSPIITNCLFDGLAFSAEDYRGGGISNHHSSPTVTNCQFINCRGGTGGAILNIVTSFITVTGCLFRGNQSSRVGHAIWVDRTSSLTMDNCILEHNGGRIVTGAAIDGSTPAPLTLTNCRFIENNSAGGWAGAIQGFGYLTLTDCTFDSNHSLAGTAGALDSDGETIMTRCHFTGNCAVSGGAVDVRYHPLSAIDCTFTRNSASNSGGAVFAGQGSTLALTNCAFLENSAQYGGAIYGYKNSAQLIGCTFTRNRAEAIPGTSRGGALYNYVSSADIVSCKFLANSSYEGGGAYDVSSSTSYINSVFVGNFTLGASGAGGAMRSNQPTIVNCVFAENASSRGGAISAVGPLNLSNSILWGNVAELDSQIHCTAVNSAVVNSDIQGGWIGTSNIDSHPLFLGTPTPGLDNLWGTPDDDYGDLRLRAYSPCIDAGGNATVPIAVMTDLAGNDRFSDIPGVHDPGAIVDMGAYERVGFFGVVHAAYTPDSPGLNITFSHAMSAESFDHSDILVRIVRSDGSLWSPVSVMGHSYDRLTNSVSFSLPISLGDSNYRAVLFAGSLTDASDAPLPFDYTFDFFSFVGDANHDRIVDVNDLVPLAKNWMGTGKTFSQGDFNYDGAVDAEDLSILAMKWQLRLDPPQPLPPPPATGPARAPTRQPTRVISLIE